MLFVSEEESERLITRSMALAAVRNALVAAADGSGLTFPMVQGIGPDKAHRFSVKSARINRMQFTGIKLGTYWPSSDAVGLPRGNSTVVFFDEKTGRIASIVVTGVANAFRTAAADALAVQLLARPDAANLAVFGAGFQAFHEVIALAEVRRLARIAVVNRTAEAARMLVQQLSKAGFNAVASNPQEACQSSDIIITVTASREPLFDDSWVQPGTHVTSMGSDSRGKQELPISLLLRGRLFADLLAQSREIGEFQHISADILSGAVSVTALGDVARGAHPGRCSPDEITVFDSSGIALQDLCVAKAILDRAREMGGGVMLP